MIETTLGPMEETALMKLEGLIDNNDQSISTVEYCLLGCTGKAHVAGKPDSVSHFCNQHVHRSVHVTVKKIDGVIGTAASLV